MSFDNEQQEITFIDGRTGETSKGRLPTNDVLKKREKEMKVVLDLIRNQGSTFVKNHITILGNPDDCGDKTFENWFDNETTRFEFFRWLFTNNHRIGGGEGQWRNGEFGSRWCDKKFNGKWCRIAFYGRDELDVIGNKYKLMICDL